LKYYLSQEAVKQKKKIKQKIFHSVEDTLEIPPRSIMRFHTGNEMNKLLNSQIKLFQESNFDLIWVGL